MCSSFKMSCDRCCRFGQRRPAPLPWQLLHNSKNKNTEIMSLFKSREWWNANCGIEETFGAFHMCIANYENTVNAAVKQIIIVGSLQGYLRIYDPKPSSSSETSCLSGLQLETQLALPVLAVLSGQFNK